MTMVRQYGRLSVADAVNTLKSSEATVRRYFNELENSGEVMRVYGGICLPVSAPGGEYHFSDRAMTRIAEKQAIGRTAASLVSDNARLFFDSGTTVRECGNALVERIGREEVHDINIVTNSLIYNDNLPLCSHLSLIGGAVRPRRMDLCGMVALNNLERYNFSMAFLGADGVAADGTLTTTDEETSILAAAVLSRSRHGVILADSSKLGYASFAPYSRLDGEKFTLITDDQAEDSLLENFRQVGVRVIVVSAGH